MEHHTHGRDDLGRLCAGLARWDAGLGVVPGLHVGDIGWALREDDAAWVAHAWWDGDDLAAVALVEGVLARPRVSEAYAGSGALAASVADVADAMVGDQLWSDAPHDSALRAALGERGWVEEDDPWPALLLDLASLPTPAPVAVHAVDRPEDRVAVQRSGFDGSTFTLEKWTRMTAGPGYRPELDLLVLDEHGTPAAAGTAWLATSGGTAILEPVATHGDHRRAGHGRRLVHALAHACRDLGARGLAVATPPDNLAAVAAYESAGFAVVGHLPSMTRRR